jgi:hypothetical protein
MLGSNPRHTERRQRAHHADGRRASLRPAFMRNTGGKHGRQGTPQGRPNDPSRLGERARAAMRRRGYAVRTQKAYLA